MKIEETRAVLQTSYNNMLRSTDVHIIRTAITVGDGDSTMSTESDYDEDKDQAKR
jgi:hypothetical protein